MSVVIVGFKKFCHVPVLKISEAFSGTAITDQNITSSLRPVSGLRSHLSAGIELIISVM